MAHNDFDRDLINRIIDCETTYNPYDGFMDDERAIETTAMLINEPNLIIKHLLSIIDDYYHDWMEDEKQLQELKNRGVLS